MAQDELKKLVGWAALDYIQPGTIIGIGTGSTVTHFIDACETIKHKIVGVVSSSNESTLKLKHLGIRILDLNDTNRISVYVDGADEINPDMQMIKGGGGALTREKIISAASDTFICIADTSKQVKSLGKFPLPIEIIPMARTYVTNILKNLGGTPRHRKDIITDNGNIILDVYNLSITDPIKLERNLNSIPGIVTVGLFAVRKADKALIGTPSGVKVIG